MAGGSPRHRSVVDRERGRVVKGRKSVLERERESETERELEREIGKIKRRTVRNRA